MHQYVVLYPEFGYWMAMDWLNEQEDVPRHGQWMFLLIHSGSTLRVESPLCSCFFLKRQLGVPTSEHG